MNIIDYWPFQDKTPRKSQVLAFEWMQSQIKNKKYLVLEAPVGSGKTAIGVTLARYLGQQSYVLTPQKILQKQYEKDFLDIKDIKLSSLYGKVNYPCVNKNTNCEIGSLLKPKCENCTHKKAKAIAEDANITVFNYDLALLYLMNPDSKFKKRKLMVLDECHSLEQILTEFDAISITYNQMQKLGIKWTQISDIQQAHKWVVNTYLPALSDKIERMESLVEELLERKGRVTPDEIYQIKEYEALNEHLITLQDFQFISSDELTKHYILVHDKLNLKFKRLYGRTTFERYIKPNAEHFLFMSSTIISFEGYCKDNGIPIEEAAFLSLKSEFPEDNREVFYIPQMKMTVNWNNPENTKQRKQMLSFIENLCEMHQGENGIIHTANFKIAEWLVENLKVTQKIFHHNPNNDLDRGVVISSFQESDVPSILISPSITEGLDLKDDLARFAIIAKVPFPHLGDQWVKARQDLSGEWYRRQAIISVIQGCGRIVRSDTDYGNVYILDGSWEALYNQSLSAIPKWWKEGYRVSD